MHRDPLQAQTRQQHDRRGLLIQTEKQQRQARRACVTPPLCPASKNSSSPVPSSKSAAAPEYDPAASRPLRSGLGAMHDTMPAVAAPPLHQACKTRAAPPLPFTQGMDLLSAHACAQGTVCNDKSPLTLAMAHTARHHHPQTHLAAHPDGGGG